MTIDMTPEEVQACIWALEEWTQEGVPGAEELQNKLKKEMEKAGHEPSVG